MSFHTSPLAAITPSATFWPSIPGCLATGSQHCGSPLTAPPTITSYAKCLATGTQVCGPPGTDQNSGMNPEFYFTAAASISAGSREYSVEWPAYDDDESHMLVNYKDTLEIAWKSYTPNNPPTIQINCWNRTNGQPDQTPLCKSFVLRSLTSPFSQTKSHPSAMVK